MHVGQVIAQRFEVTQFIRQGGMGAVYRGVDRHGGQAVAIKLLKAEALTDDPANVERFAREGEALRALNHPNIVKMLGMVEEHGQRYLIMEYVGGGSLADLLGAQPQLPIRQVLQIALDLADALTRTHRLDIIHRDLKPANVLLAEDGTPRLTDFGVARIGSSDMTDSGQVLGTYSYLSPEALNGLTLDGRADIWAFGVLLFEMLAGCKPFVGDNPGALMRAILTRAVPDLEALRTDAPIGLIDLVYRMLERDREQRIGSVRIVGVEVEALLRGEITPSLRPGPSGSAAGLEGSTLFTLSTPSEGERTPHNLPAQATEFVGREAELTELAKLLALSRLVTVLGPGGIGKSRLALEGAAAQVQKFGDGVYFVSLAPLSASETIVPAIAEAVGVSFYGGSEPNRQLLDFLRTKRMLLLLDNFEHLLDGVGLISEILQAAPNVKMLATSRERLNAEGEVLFRLEGMDFPDWETPEDAADYSAVKLFLQSARRVQPDFGLDAENLTYVARICRLVQGMPLGILLAAAWVETLALPEIAQEIQNSLGFLETEQRDIPARHRSLRAAFDYSWNLLADSEREVFAKLSVFRGGFTREAAQQVAGASLKILMTLVNKSLLRRDAATGRYEVHELLRQYAQDKLAATHDAASTSDRHLNYFVNLAEQAEPQLWRTDQLAWLRRLDTEFDNVRTALAWSVDHDPQAGLRLASALEKFWLVRGHWNEARDWFFTLLESGKKPTPARAKVLYLLGNLLSAQRSGTPANPLHEESLAIGKSLKDRRIIAYALYGLGRLNDSLSLFRELGDEIGMILSLSASGHEVNALGDKAQARAYFEENLALCRRLGHELGVAGTLLALALTMNRTGGYVEAARPLAQESLAIYQAFNDRPGLAVAFAVLGMIEGYHTDLDLARTYIQESIAIAREMGDMGRRAYSGMHLSAILRLQGQYDEALRQVEESIQVFRHTNDEFGLIWAFGILGFISLKQGNPERARSLFEESISLVQKSGFRRYLPHGLVGLACVVSQPEQAARLLGAASRYIGESSTPADRADYEEIFATVRTHLGDAAFNAAYAKGQAMTLEQAIVDALQDEDQEN